MKERRLYPWKDTRLGRVGLCVIWHIAEKQVGDSRYGVSMADLFLGLIHRCPWIPKEYARVTGRTLTQSIVYNRWHKMLYDTGRRGRSKAAAIGREHPKNHHKLEGVYARVEAALEEDGVITLKQAFHLGTLK